jgi:periplasmic divalent cation tolerance protein
MAASVRANRSLRLIEPKTDHPPGSNQFTRREPMGEGLVVFVTTASEEEAARIAEAVVGERLAACVNIVPAVKSVYRWEGKVVRDDELLMVIKTTSERYDQLERRVKELHSYTTAEVIACRIERGSGDYLSWLRDQTAPEAAL